MTRNAAGSAPAFRVKDWLIQGCALTQSFFCGASRARDVYRSSIPLLFFLILSFYHLPNSDLCPNGKWRIKDIQPHGYPCVAFSIKIGPQDPFEHIQDVWDKDGSLNIATQLLAGSWSYSYEIPPPQRREHWKYHLLLAVLILSVEECFSCVFSLSSLFSVSPYPGNRGEAIIVQYSKVVWRIWAYLPVVRLLIIIVVLAEVRDTASHIWLHMLKCLQWQITVTGDITGLVLLLFKLTLGVEAYKMGDLRGNEIISNIQIYFHYSNLMFFFWEGFMVGVEATLLKRNTHMLGHLRHCPITQQAWYT